MRVSHNAGVRRRLVPVPLGPGASGETPGGDGVCRRPHLRSDLLTSARTTRSAATAVSTTAAFYTVATRQPATAFAAALASAST